MIAPALDLSRSGNMYGAHNSADRVRRPSYLALLLQVVPASKPRGSTCAWALVG